MQKISRFAHARRIRNWHGSCPEQDMTQTRSRKTKKSQEDVKMKKAGLILIGVIVFLCGFSLEGVYAFNWGSVARGLSRVNNVVSTVQTTQTHYQVNENLKRTKHYTRAKQYEAEQSGNLMGAQTRNIDQQTRRGSYCSVFVENSSNDIVQVRVGNRSFKVPAGCTKRIGKLKTGRKYMYVWMSSNGSGDGQMDIGLDAPEHTMYVGR